MNKIVWVLVFLLAACQVQTENSSSTDADIYGNPTGDNVSPAFAAARTILASKCAGCHSYSSATEAQLVAAGLVVAGNAEASKIYYRMTGSTGSGSPKDMPQSAAALTATQLDAVKTWIQNLQ